ncbi:DUF6000 family protein [Streptomyces sp. NBC_00433]
MTSEPACLAGPLGETAGSWVLAGQRRSHALCQHRPRADGPGPTIRHARPAVPPAGRKLAAVERARARVCISLATFCTSADADLVCRYLDRYLPQPELVRDQTGVLSTLLHLDAVLGTERAAPHLAAGGLWQQWSDATPNMVRDPQEYRKVVDQLCSFASECAELFARPAGTGTSRRCGHRYPPQ